MSFLYSCNNIIHRTLLLASRNAAAVRQGISAVSGSEIAAKSALGSCMALAGLFKPQIAQSGGPGYFPHEGRNPPYCRCYLSQMDNQLDPKLKKILDQYRRSDIHLDSGEMAA